MAPLEMPKLPHALLALDLSALVGQSEEDARATVEGVGGIFQVVPSANGPMTADLVPRRVRAVLRNGRVTEVIGLEGRPDVDRPDSNG